MKIVDSLPLFGLSQFFSRILFFIALKNFVITRFFKGSYFKSIPVFTFKRHRTNKKSFCEILIHKDWGSSDEGGVE